MGDYWSIREVAVRVPTLSCGLRCSSMYWPAGLWLDHQARPASITLNVLPESEWLKSYEPLYELAGSESQAIMRERALLIGWKQVSVYGVEIWVCPQCIAKAEGRAI